MKPSDQLIRDVTEAYLATLNRAALPTIDQIAETLVTQTSTACAVYNTSVDKSMKIKPPTSLLPAQIGAVILELFPVCRIAMAENNLSGAVLALYQTDGPNEGIYDTDEDTIQNFVSQFKWSITTKEIEEVIAYLNRKAAIRVRCSDQDLIAVNNGIFNYQTKTLTPFTPDLVFTSKSHVNYNPQATNVVIHNNTDNTDWDVESWMHTLSDDDDIVTLLWEVLGAIVRPNVRWNKSAWLYSETGNNGKGTLCELMRSLCGRGAYASIPISDFGKDFMLEPLLSVNAVIVDENDVGSYIDRAANLKAVITNDVIQVNRKFKTPVPLQFHGFMVQCLNEFPKIRDRSDSVYRRQLFIPMQKCFTGKERRYIKNDYLHRNEVLEYVLKRVLESNYYELSCPASCQLTMSEYQNYNDPVRQFFDDTRYEFAWDFLPFLFLYDLYCAWMKKNNPAGSLMSKSTFIKEIVPIACKDGTWTVTRKNANGTSYAKVRPRDLMNKPEYLSMEYDLRKWMQPNAGSMRPDLACIPQVKDYYYGGLIRTSLQLNGVTVDTIEASNDSKGDTECDT